MPVQQDFKFVWVKDGKVSSLFSKAGFLNQDGVSLDGELIPLASIINTTVHDRRLVIGFLAAADGAQPDARFLVVQIAKASALDLKRAIDRMVSELRAKLHKQELDTAGKSHLYQAVPCPTCKATVDASEKPKTKQLFCTYCDTLSQDGRVIHTDRYRVCPECDMFDRVQSYTEFYFYFVLVAYGFRSRQRFLCDGCAGRLFWRVFLINFIFILGIVPAIWMKVKSMRGRRPDLAQLTQANSLMRAGKRQEAAALYQRMHGGFGGHPGLYFNEQRDQDALAVCSTYERAAGRLAS